MWPYNNSPSKDVCRHACTYAYTMRAHTHLHTVYACVSIYMSMLMPSHMPPACLPRFLEKAWPDHGHGWNHKQHADIANVLPHASSDQQQPPNWNQPCGCALGSHSSPVIFAIWLLRVIVIELPLSSYRYRVIVMALLLSSYRYRVIVMVYRYRVISVHAQLLALR